MSEQKKLSISPVKTDGGTTHSSHRNWLQLLNSRKKTQRAPKEDVGHNLLRIFATDNIDCDEYFASLRKKLAEQDGDSDHSVLFARDKKKHGSESLLEEGYGEDFGSLEGEFRYEEEETKKTKADESGKGVFRREEKKSKKDKRDTCLPCMDGFMETILKLQAEAGSEEGTIVEDVKLNVTCDHLPHTVNDKVIVRPKDMNEAQQNAFNYMEKKRVHEIIQLVISHSLAVVPEDYITFMVTFFEKCIRFRDGKGPPPLLFDSDHQEIVYMGLDPSDAGVITHQQYCNENMKNHITQFSRQFSACAERQFQHCFIDMNGSGFEKGIKTMGVREFNTKPPTLPNGLIKKEVFLEEADNALRKQMADVVCTLTGTTDEYKAEIAKKKTYSKTENIGEFLDESAETSNVYVNEQDFRSPFEVDSRELFTYNYGGEDEGEVSERFLYGNDIQQAMDIELDELQLETIASMIEDIHTAAIEEAITESLSKNILLENPGMSDIEEEEE